MTTILVCYKSEYDRRQGENSGTRNAHPDLRIIHFSAYDPAAVFDLAGHQIAAVIGLEHLRNEKDKEYILSRVRHVKYQD